MIFFLLGKSGVGKTTIIDSLSSMATSFNAPTLLTTRLRRKDDDVTKILSITVERYLKLRESGQLFTDIDDGITYYGYLQPPNDSRAHLMYGSPLQFDTISNQGKCILIEREVIAIEKIRDKTRIKLNEYADSRYYKNPVFRRKLDIIVDNNGELSETIRQVEGFVKNQLK